MLFHPHAPNPIIDLEVKFADIELFCLIKCLYYISHLSESIHISNKVLTTDPRVHAMGGAGGQNIKHPHTLV